MRSIQRSTLLALSFTLAALGGACGSSGGGGGGSTAPSTLYVMATDAPSDQIVSFRVEVQNVRLVRSNGAGVDVLAAPAELDFASLSDARQLLTVKSVPSGSYATAEATLDFSNAVCVLQGKTIPADLLGSEGQPLSGTMTLPIELGAGVLDAPEDGHLELELDFDLDQSVVVDAGQNAVWVEPVIVLRVDPPAPKQVFALGELGGVDTTASTFELDAQTLAGAPLGTFEFHVLQFTVFHVDGVASFGANGLAALDAKGPGTSTQVFGTLDKATGNLFAVYVAAGKGTFNGGSDIVEGYVIARPSGAGTSPTLTLLGHSINADHTEFQFNKTFTIDTSLPATKVVRWSEASALDMDDVNVGQRIRAFGALSGTDMDATQPDDVIRLELTPVWGHANDAPSGGKLAIDLSRVGPYDSSAFTWSNSGTTPPDPAAFELDVVGLAGGLGIAAGSPIGALGHFAPLDDAGPDFDALTLANLEDAPSLVFVRNIPNVGLELMVTATSASVQLEITETAVPGETAVVDQGFAGSQPLPTSSPAILEPPASCSTLYFLTDKVTGGTTLYLQFSAFSKALAQMIASGAEVSQVSALGQYDEPSNTLVTPLMSVCVK
jgi:Domain of unknown function (DUF4382)